MIKKIVILALSIFSFAFTYTAVNSGHFYVSPMEKMYSGSAATVSGRLGLFNKYPATSLSLTGWALNYGMVQSRAGLLYGAFTIYRGTPKFGIGFGLNIGDASVQAYSENGDKPDLFHSFFDSDKLILLNFLAMQRDHSSLSIGAGVGFLDSKYYNFGTDHTGKAYDLDRSDNISLNVQALYKKQMEKYNLLFSAGVNQVNITSYDSFYHYLGAGIEKNFRIQELRYHLQYNQDNRLGLDGLLLSHSFDYKLFDKLGFVFSQEYSPADVVNDLYSAGTYLTFKRFSFNFAYTESELQPYFGGSMGFKMSFRGKKSEEE